MKQSTRRDLILRLVLFGSLGLVVVVLWPFLRGVPPVGPTVLKTDASGTVWVLLNLSLHAYDSSGRPGALFDFADKVQGDVSDFEISPDGDVYLAEVGTRTIWKFGADGQAKGKIQLPRASGDPECDKPNLVFQTKQDGGTVFTLNIFGTSMAADWGEKRLFVAESARHRVHVVDLESGQVLETLRGEAEHPG